MKKGLLIAAALMLPSSVHAQYLSPYPSEIQRHHLEQDMREQQERIDRLEREQRYQYENLQRQQEQQRNESLWREQEREWRRW
jgi:flagellar motility protein MotE (MotC chaperone)